MLACLVMIRRMCDQYQPIEQLFDEEIIGFGQFSSSWGIVLYLVSKQVRPVTLLGICATSCRVV